MRTFPLLNIKKNNPFSRNPLGCACFCCLAIFGALIGRAAFASVYDERVQAMISGLTHMAKPQYRPAQMLVYALLPPLAYGAVIYISGLRRMLLPLWAAAVLVQGMTWGMQLGAAGTLFALAYIAAAWLTVLLPMLMLLPLYAYIALLALERVRRNAPVRQAGRLELLMSAVIPSAALAALSTLSATLSCLYCLSRLFH